MVALLHQSNGLEIYSALTDTELSIPVASSPISAGFPSPAADFIDSGIDLNQHLISHPSATFYGKVKGQSMIGMGINDGDMLVIDKSIEPADGKIVVCFIDGEFTLKQLKVETDCAWLMPANDKYNPIKVTSDNDFVIWGVVTYVIKKF